MSEDGTGGGAAQRLAKGTAVRDVLDFGDPRAWLALDEGVRSSAPTRLLPTRAELYGPRSRAGLPPRPPRLSEPRLALALCHRDGRIREAALVLAADRPALWPLVVVRTADWVPAVRESARGCCVRCSTWTPPSGSRR